MRIFLLALLFAGMAGSVSAARTACAHSPDGRSELTFWLDESGRPTYSFLFRGRQAILPSGMGFRMLRGGNYLDGFSGFETTTGSHDETWQTVWGEEREIRDRHEELAVRLLRDGGSPMTIRFRVFDDGVGFRYEFTPQDAGASAAQLSRRPLVVGNEATEFALSGDPTAWWIPGDYESQEYLYHETRASGIAKVQATETLKGSDWSARAGSNTVQTALMLKTPDGLYVNLHEAACVDFPTLYLEWKPGRNAFESLLTPSAEGDRGRIYGRFDTPWRTVIVAEDACGILASRMTLNLNEPCKISDTSWIRPMKYIGIWWEMVCGRTSWWSGDRHGPSPENVKRYIDFAAEHGFDAVLLEGWNDGRPVPYGPRAGNFHNTTGDFDAEKVAAYSREKGVSLILHAETSSSVRDFERNADEIYSWWHGHNAAAIKSGYVDEVQPGGNFHYNQWMNSHYLFSVKKAAEHRVMVNQHEAVRPTGLCRTYPNLVANEAARGGEFWPHDGGIDVRHTLVLPFTRLVGGPMDFTPGILETDLSRNCAGHRQRNIGTTVCRQLSLYLTMPSPLQMAADLPENYLSRMELFEFIKAVPVDWAKSVYLDAEVARHLVVARKDRNSDDWYVGGAADADGYLARFRLDFLDAGRSYRAKIWSDGENASFKSNTQSYRISDRMVGKGDEVEVRIAPGGGFAIRLAPCAEGDGPRTAEFSHGFWRMAVSPQTGGIVSLKWKDAELVSNPGGAQTASLNCADLSPDVARGGGDGEAHGIVEAATMPTRDVPVRLVATSFDEPTGTATLDYETGSWRLSERIVLGDGSPSRLSRTVSFRHVKDAALKFKGLKLVLPLRLEGGYYLPGGFFTDLCWREDNRVGWPKLDWSRRRGRLADFRRGGNDRVKFAFFDQSTNLTVMAFCDARMDGASLSFRKDGKSFAVSWNIGAQGWCEPGCAQSVQKQWIEAVEKPAERALDENAPALLSDIGLVPPKTRPDWVFDAAIYGIETDPFRGERLEDIPRVVAPRMRQLGLDTCWYRPCEAGTARYCPIDYRVIEPKIGTADDYRAANEGMHAAGLRVLQDIVPHGGGQLGFYLRGHSCSMQGMTENGDVLDMWSADFADPRWRDYMRGVCALYTGEWKTDGFRVDAIYGSKTLRNWRRSGWPAEAPQIVPSYDWNRRTGRRLYDAYWRQSLALDGGEMPPIAYDRASLASSWGGLRMVDAMREGATSGCRDAALLLECGELPFVAAGDLTYDRDIQSLWFKLRALSPEDFVLGLKTWLHEEQKVDPPGAVRMRYMETGDGESWPYRNWYGRSADRAIRALCTFVDGVPMFFENFTEGDGDYIAMLMRIRREVKALRRGVADYAGVQCDSPGVFAFSRDCPGSSAVVAINFTPGRKKFRSAELAPWGFAVWENGRRVDDSYRDPALAGLQELPQTLKPEVVNTEDGVEYRFPGAVRWELDTAEGLLADTMPVNETPRRSRVVDYNGKRPSVRRDPSRIWRGAENPAAGSLRVTDGKSVFAMEIPDGGYNDALFRDRDGKTCLAYLKGRGIPTRNDGATPGVGLENASTHWIVTNAFYSMRLARANGVVAGTDLVADRVMAGGGPYAVASGDPDSLVRVERVDGRLVMTFRGEIRAPYAVGANRLRLETKYVFDGSDKVVVDYALTPSGTANAKPSVAFVADGVRHDFFAAAKGPLVPRRTYRFGYTLSGGRREWCDCDMASAENEGYSLGMTGVNATWIDREFGLDGENGVRMAWCNPSVRMEVAPDELTPGRYTLSFYVRGELLKDPAVRKWSEKVSPFHPFVKEYTRLDATLRYFDAKGERRELRAERRIGKEFGWERMEIDFEVPEAGSAPEVSLGLFNEYAGVTYLTKFRFSARWRDGEDETEAIQRRIDEASARGGGRVSLKAGVHRVKPLQLKSGVELHLEEGARLLGSPFGGDYPDIPLRHADSSICPRGRSSALVWADEATDIALTGPGVLDGNGKSFLRIADEFQQTWGYRHVRRYGFSDSPPRMCLFAGCRGVRVEGLGVEGLPGGWAFWVHDCDDVLFDGVRIAADVDCANNDGIHVNCSRDVTIRNCDITTGDDAVVVRANSRSLKENRACERVAVSNCTLRSWSCGVRIGWSNDGTMRDCVFKGIKMRDTTFGVGIELPNRLLIPSDYGREATLVERMVFEDVDMDGIYAHPLYCTVSENPSTLCAGISDLTFRRVRARCLELPYFRGRADAPFERFVFEDCRFDLVGDDVLPGSDRHGAASKCRHREPCFSGAVGFAFDGRPVKSADDFRGK